MIPVRVLWTRSRASRVASISAAVDDTHPDPAKVHAPSSEVGHFAFVLAPRDQVSPGGGGVRRRDALDIVSPSAYGVDMAKRGMQEATFLILTALAGGAQHGYGIIADIEEISEGRVRLQAGTLYAALDRLRDEGLIEVDR